MDPSHPLYPVFSDHGDNGPAVYNLNFGDQIIHGSCQKLYYLAVHDYETLSCEDLRQLITMRRLPKSRSKAGMIETLNHWDRITNNKTAPLPGRGYEKYPLPDDTFTDPSKRNSLFLYYEKQSSPSRRCRKLTQDEFYGFLAFKVFHTKEPLNSLTLSNLIGNMDPANIDFFKDMVIKAPKDIFGIYGDESDHYANLFSQS